MAVPECPYRNIAPLPTERQRRAELVAIERQLEVADENENPIERAFKRDQLLEQQDELQSDFDAPVSSPELP